MRGKTTAVQRFGVSSDPRESVVPFRFVEDSKPYGAHRKHATHHTVRGPTEFNLGTSPKHHFPPVFTDGHKRDELSRALQGEDDRGLAELLAEVSACSIAETSGAVELPHCRSLLKRAGKYLAQQSQIRSELRSMVLTDELTGLYNRRGFFILGKQFLKLARRNGLAVQLFFADVDHFKAINDHYGHAAGDACLARCAQVLRDTFRESDIIARFGGDEFAVLALEANGQSEEAILRRLKLLLKKANVGVFPCELSLSIGTARFDSASPASLEHLLITADRRMYERKRASICAAKAG